MLTRRLFIRLLSLTPISFLLGWRRKPEPEPDVFVIQTSNLGTEDEQTTVQRITPTMSYNTMGATPNNTTPREHLFFPPHWTVEMQEESIRRLPPPPPRP